MGQTGEMRNDYWQLFSYSILEMHYQFIALQLIALRIPVYSVHLKGFTNLFSARGGGALNQTRKKEEEKQSFVTICIAADVFVSSDIQ